MKGRQVIKEKFRLVVKSFFATPSKFVWMLSEIMMVIIKRQKK